MFSIKYLTITCIEKIFEFLFCLNLDVVVLRIEIFKGEENLFKSRSETVESEKWEEKSFI